MVPDAVRRWFGRGSEVVRRWLGRGSEVVWMWVRGGWLGRVFASGADSLAEVKVRVRQRSGEGVVRRNGCPKGCFWRVRFFSAPLRFVLKNN